jgi:NADH-quinone oxidoreductase E subunit
MAWIVENRRTGPGAEKEQGPYLTDDMKMDLAARYFPRYPTRRAVTLPALHCIQHKYGWIPAQALAEVAEFLQQTPAEVMDTATFYEEFWLKPKGKYLIAVCRSLSCEICGSAELTERLKRKLKIDPGQTTADGRFTLIEVECLGSCGTAPCALCNEVLHENLTAQNADAVIDALPADPSQYKDPTMTWDEAHGH